MMRFWSDRSGAVAMYAAFVGALVIGSGVLVFDWGRAVVLKGQMQNAADAMALSAAKQLDGKSGARDRAKAVAEDTLRHGSYIPESAGAFTISDMKYFLRYDRTAPKSGTSGYCTTDGSGSDTNSCKTVQILDSWTGDAADVVTSTVAVELVTEDVTILLKPVVDMLSGGGGPNAFRVNARAVAERSDIGCDVAPFFVCNPNDPVISSGKRNLLDAEDTGGAQMIIKSGAGNANPLTPGNFGVLCPSVDASGNCTAGGAQEVNDSLVASETDLCTPRSLVATQPGNMQNKAADGVGVRFDRPNPGGNTGDAASDIVGYYKDTDVSNFDESTDTGVMGNGNWNANAYWTTFHASTDTLPTAFDTDTDGIVDTDVSRYQMYLWEKNLPFCRKGGATYYTGSTPTCPAGYTAVSGTGNEDGGVPADDRFAITDDTTTPVTRVPKPGVPVTDDSQRRVLTVAIVDCKSLQAAGFNIQGRTEGIPVTGGFADFFLTECPCATGGECNSGEGACSAVEDDPGPCTDAGNTSAAGGCKSQSGAVYSEVIGPSSDTVNSGLIVTNVRLVD